VEVYLNIVFSKRLRDVHQSHFNTHVFLTDSDERVDRGKNHDHRPGRRRWRRGGRGGRGGRVHRGDGSLPAARCVDRRHVTKHLGRVDLCLTNASFPPVAPAWGDSTATDQSETASEAPGTTASDSPAPPGTPRPNAAGKRHHFTPRTVRPRGRHVLSQTPPPTHLPLPPPR